MMKQALRSYISSLHPRNLKKLRESAGYLWTYLIFVFIYGGTALLPEKNYADIICMSAIRMIPLFLMKWSNLSPKYLMSKALFLCPMKQEERKAYINNVLIVKIGAMMISSILVELVWSFVYGFCLWEIAIIVFVMFSIGIAEYIAFTFHYQEVRKASFFIRAEDGRCLCVGLNSVSLVIGMLLIYLFTAIDMEVIVWNEAKTVLFHAGILVCMILLIIFDVVIIKQQYHYVIEQSSDYELQYRIKGKIESVHKYDLFSK